MSNSFSESDESAKRLEGVNESHSQTPTGREIERISGSGQAEV